MSDERTVESPLYRPAPGLILAIVATLGWTALTLMSLLLDWDYVAPGYRTVGDDISAAGAQIWGLPWLLALLMAASVILVMILFIRQLRGRRPGLIFTLTTGLALCALLLLLAPPAVDFQVRYYHGPGDRTMVLFTGHRTPLFRYTESHEESTLYGEGDGDTRHFVCLTDRTWKVGVIRVSRSLFPILDKENQQRILESQCRER
ncbi:hypothetical protein [Alloalcanivorax xenomutans]|uniref:hypothetical protein n=1 Tax=Alloalcanivorax xenomutans TaxID=1094342 RepID=UPI0003B83917|nr:hypothetical protein [Alloalcanivorax xenomutans]ARB47579.1 hypothetical protein P40_21005 [Alloalcanivorax xenomutans]ERS09322.1 hypothetical protein Q668_04265 [Alcanivorax sp. PN-3]